MGRAPVPHLLALVCGLMVAFAVGCGDRSNLIAPGTASSLTQQLADIRSAIDAGQCDGLADKVRAFHDDATNLSGTVDKRLRQRINEGVRSLQANAVTDCQTTQASQTDTATTDVTTTETQADTTTTEATTVPTTATATDTTTTPTVPTDTTPTTTTPGTTTDGATGTPTTAATTPDSGGFTPQEGATP